MLAALRAWAAVRRDVRAAALVGSWARGAARADSDLDIVLLTDRPAAYVGGDDWVAGLGATSVIRTARWGNLVERRLARPGGLELDVGIALPTWAAIEPLDAGSARVAADGLVALYDPDGLLRALAAAVGAGR